MQEQTVQVSTPEELANAISESPAGTQITVDENLPKKRKKYTPRQGTSCPICGGNLRSIFYSKNDGGFQMAKMHGICQKCNEEGKDPSVFKYIIRPVETMIVERKKE